MPTGTKLVAGLAVLALTLGVVSWWYRFESAHRSTEFWGPTAAELIARPSEVTASTLVSEGSADGSSHAPQEILVLGPQQLLVTDAHDVTDIPGMVHLRNSLLSDGNYYWTTEATAPRWQWCLQFANKEEKVCLLFSEDFAVVGLLEEDRVRAVDCQPMAETLRQYCTSAKLFDASKTSE